MPETKSGSPTGFMVIELSVKLPVKVPDEAVWLSELYTGFVCAFFGAYESSTNSLTTSTPTVTFSPDETVNNPYYSYAQNQLNISVSIAV